MPWSLTKHWNNFSSRDFHLSAMNREGEVSKPNPVAYEEMNHVAVRRIDKTLLVWSGKYKSVQEVPDRVSRAVLAKCHSVCRVKTCNYMMAVTVIAAIFYAMSGKRDSEKGITISQMNRDWHKEYNKKHEEEQKNLK